MSNPGGVLVHDKRRGWHPWKASYEGAGYDSRDMRHWRPRQGTSADNDLEGERGTLTARSHDLGRNNGVAASYQQTYVDNTIGPQLKLSATPNWRVLGQSEEWADEWAPNTEAHWRTYAGSLNFDLQRRVNFHGMAALVLREKLNGDAVVIPRWKPNRPGVKYATCFQIIDSQRLCNPDYKLNTDRLRDGIEYNASGAPIAYHIRNRLPNDSYQSVRGGLHRWERVRAFTRWGRAKVLHCYQPLRAEQSRGTPKLASVLREFKALSRYTQAELNAAVSHALATFFVESNLGSELMGIMFGQGSDEYMASRQEITGSARDDFAGANMGDNMIVPLMPGDKIVDPVSNRPSDQFEPFVKYNLRKTAAGLGISYEMLMRDFSSTNYSSARAAMLLDWKTFTGELNWLSTYYASLVYAVWIEEAIDRGDIEAPGFFSNREAYCACKFTGAARGHVDPIKESKASTEKLHNGISNLSKEVGEQADDWEENMDQRAKEIKRAFTQAERLELPEAAAYVLAGLPVPGQFELQSPIDPDNGPGAVTQTESDQAEDEGVSQGREAAVADESESETEAA